MGKSVGNLWHFQMQIKTAMSYYLTPVRIALIENTRNDVWVRIREKNP